MEMCGEKSRTKGGGRLETKCQSPGWLPGLLLPPCSELWHHVVDQLRGSSRRHLVVYPLRDLLPDSPCHDYRLREATRRTRGDSGVSVLTHATLWWRLNQSLVVTHPGPGGRLSGGEDKKADFWYSFFSYWWKVFKIAKQSWTFRLGPFNFLLLLTYFMEIKRKSQ